jgi:hypothetical protein
MRDKAITNFSLEPLSNLRATENSNQCVVYLHQDLLQWLERNDIEPLKKKAIKVAKDYLRGHNISGSRIHGHESRRAPVGGYKHYYLYWSKNLEGVDWAETPHFFIRGVFNHDFNGADPGVGDDHFLDSANYRHLVRRQLTCAQDHFALSGPSIEISRAAPLVAEHILNKPAYLIAHLPSSEPPNDPSRMPGQDPDSDGNNYAKHGPEAKIHPNTQDLSDNSSRKQTR